MTVRPILSFLLGTIVAFSSLYSPISAIARPLLDTNSPAAPLDIPDIVVASDVSDYAVAAPKVFWSTRSAGCPPAVAAAAEASAPKSPNSPESPAIVPYDEYVRRVSIYGSEPRTLWQNITSVCGTSRIIASNIVADSDFVYWTTSSALVRQSTNANVGDTPEIVTTEISGTTELAIDSVYVHVLKGGGSNPNYTARVWSVKKSDKSVKPLASRTNLTGYPNSIASNLGTRLSGDSYVYWLESGRLMRYNLNTDAIGSIATGVSNFYPEGPVTLCFLVSCSTTDYVFIANGASLSRYNNVDSASDGVIYTAPTNHAVQGINSDKNQLFLNLRETLPCAPEPCFTSFVDHLYRRGRSNTGTAALLYTLGTPTIFGGIGTINTASDYVFWQEDATVKRLPKDAAALPKTNMKVTGFSITQGIQKPDNSVILIKDRKTFVRLFVQSDGPANVAGATARLYRVDAIGNILGTVLPANQPNTNITIRTSPNRNNLNDSFLFELPWSWVAGGSLRLKASLNPFHIPVESSYADNDSTLGTFTLNTSAALKVNFISWGYTTGGKTYWPRFIKDIVQTYSWVSRAYPLASKIVFDGASGNSPGFHPNLWFQFDDTLGAKVMGTHDECKDLLVKNPDNTVKSDNRNMCASRYTNYQMVAMRSENGLPGKRFFYGFISDGAKFPRGQACCGAAVSSGPAGAGDWGWDFDGSYADWYAAHEIGHTLGRAHPDAGSDNPATKDTRENCGHSRSDPSFPYGNTSSARAPIGTGNAEGFDGGDASLSIPRAVYPSSIWNDVMSYCDSQWMSDYTFKGMYDFMKNSPPPLAAQRGAQSDTQNVHVHADGQLHIHSAASATLNENAPSVTGDFLLVNGTILSGTNSATLQNVTRVSSVPEIPSFVPGGYAIRLFNNSNTQLAEYPFSAEAYHHGDADVLQINQVITFAVGTGSLRIVRLADNVALVTKTVSSNAPVVSNVALQGAPNPVAGTVPLGWNASDADGDTLTFDVFYSLDGGTTLQPVASGISGNTTQIDTSLLGGSTNAILRVVAHDGVNTGAANSAAFTMANKAPQPMIIDPSTGHTVQYGQLVNFSGAAIDWQDGGVTGANLVWSTKKGPLGAGELISSDNLPVGSNVITLTATNSKGLSASTNITVVVQDNLELAGPTLNVDQNQVSWQFAKDATLLVDKNIEVSNSGSGELNWSASTSVPWLTISPITGTTSANITLTADPAAIANGTALSGTVIISAPPTDGQPAQSVTVTVGLAKDINAYTYSGTSPDFSLYMPTLMR